MYLLQAVVQVQVVVVQVQLEEMQEIQKLSMYLVEMVVMV
jgi:hypothetical protein